MLGIIQARYSSKRLRGKVLRLLLGKPMLQWTLESLAKTAGLTEIIVATSDEESDDPIAEFCKQSGWNCYRGSLNHVADRFASILHIEKPSFFVRISGDSPLIDPKVVEQAITLYRASECDLVSNVCLRTFPKGQSVEVLRTKTFLNVVSHFSVADQEHVTPYYYQHPKQFQIVSFTSGEDAGQCQLSVDTLEDFQRIECLLRQTEGKTKSWQELWRMSENLG